MQECTGKVEPCAIRVVQRYGWHVEGRERDASDDLVPFEADPEETLKWSGGAAMLYEGENMVEDALFKIDVAPSEACSEPESAEHYCLAHFSTKSAFT